MNKPLVSICMITYNHALYISKAIEGVVNQRTNFPIELVIGEDCSTDKTREIIEGYKEKYPAIIRLLPKCENLGMMNNFNRTLQECSGKYIALCEGDDYWAEPLKLQKQVDFLESHPEYSMCFHNAINHYQDIDREDEPFANLTTREYSRKELIETWTAPTASFFFRKGVIASNLYQNSKSTKIITGDLMLMLCASYFGKVWGMADIMSVYRISHEGVLQKVLAKQHYALTENYIELKRLLPDDVSHIFNKIIGKRAGLAVSMMRKDEFKDGWKLWKLIFSQVPLQCLKASIKYFTFGIQQQLRNKSSKW